MVSRLPSDNGGQTLGVTPPNFYALQLGPGQTIHFTATVRLTQGGWAQIGVIGQAANGLLAPMGEKVHLVEVGALLPLAAAVLATFLAGFGIAAGIIWAVFRPNGRPPLVPDRLRLGTGAALLLPGSAIPILAGLSVAFPLPLAAGWLLAGAGLRPRGSARRGTLLAGTAYLLVGMLWVVGFNLRIGTPPVALFSPWLVFLGLIWPLQIAQVFGWFGLSLG